MKVVRWWTRCPMWQCQGASGSPALATATAGPTTGAIVSHCKPTTTGIVTAGVAIGPPTSGTSATTTVATAVTAATVQA